MKYISINHFDDFVFHDAKFTFVSYQDNALVVSAKELNIRKGTEQNENKLDMELGHAIITFENFVVECYEYSKGYQIDEHGNWYIDEAQIIYQGKDAEKAFIDALKEEFSINGLTTRQKQERTIIELDTNYGVYFSAVCSCTNIQVEWDEYRGKAWYEKYRNYKYEVSLITPDGEQKTVLFLRCTIDDNEEVTEVGTYIRYEGKDYLGTGKDYLWIDAIADLQNKLPDGVLLKCCLACRHGNLCPVGNCEKEVFCMQDIVPKDKEDLYFYTEDENERRKRSRMYFDCCETFAPWCKECYTYNDFGHYLN